MHHHVKSIFFNIKIIKIYFLLQQVAIDDGDDNVLCNNDERRQDDEHDDELLQNIICDHFRRQFANAW